MRMRLGFVIALLALFLTLSETSFAQTSSSSVAKLSGEGCSAGESTRAAGDRNLAEQRKGADVDWFGHRSAFGLLLWCSSLFSCPTRKNMSAGVW